MSLHNTITYRCCGMTELQGHEKDCKFNPDNILKYTESDLAAKQVELLRETLGDIEMLEIGSCSCLTKSHVPDEHTENCLFRRICNVEGMIQDKINKQEGK